MVGESEKGGGGLRGGATTRVIVSRGRLQSAQGHRGICASTSARPSTTRTLSLTLDPLEPRLPHLTVLSMPMSSSATPQPRGTAKPPKLRLDMVYGPPPNPDGKYRSASQFSNSALAPPPSFSHKGLPPTQPAVYRAYQWTQGFDVTVGFENPAATRLNCNTHPSVSHSLSLTPPGSHN